MPAVHAVEIADGHQGWLPLIFERAHSVDTPSLHSGGFYYGDERQAKTARGRNRRREVCGADWRC
jgi:hypothetical protein